MAFRIRPDGEGFVVEFVRNDAVTKTWVAQSTLIERWKERQPPTDTSAEQAELKTLVRQFEREGLLVARRRTAPSEARALFASETVKLVRLEVLEPGKVLETDLRSGAATIREIPEDLREEMAFDRPVIRLMTQHGLQPPLPQEGDVLLVTTLNSLADIDESSPRDVAELRDRLLRFAPLASQCERWTVVESPRPIRRDIKLEDADGKHSTLAKLAGGRPLYFAGDGPAQWLVRRTVQRAEPLEATRWARQLRGCLEAGLMLPGEDWDFLLANGVSKAWGDLLRSHCQVCWPHIPELPVTVLARYKTWGELGRWVQQNSFAVPGTKRLVSFLDGTARFLDDDAVRLKHVPLALVAQHQNKKFAGGISEETLLPLLANDLGVAPDATWATLRAVVDEHRRAYQTFRVWKTNGTRRIDVPPPTLAKAQRRIADLLTAYGAYHRAATAFVPGRGPAVHARHHAGAAMAVCVDVENFFGSINHFMVARALGLAHHTRLRPRHNPFAHCPPAALRVIARIVTHPRGFLPQGAPSSPAVANLVAMQFDELITKQLEDTDWRYTRYADDVVVSMPRYTHASALDEMTKLLDSALDVMHWRPAAEKTHAWHARTGRPLVVCGLRLPREYDGPLTLSRETARRVRSAAHHARHEKSSKADEGMLAYAYSVTGNFAYRYLASKPTRDAVDKLGVFYDLAERESYRAVWTEETTTPPPMSLIV